MQQPRQKVFSKMSGWEGNRVETGQQVRGLGVNELTFRTSLRSTQPPKTGNRVVVGDEAVLRNLKIVFTASDSELWIGAGAKLTGHIIVHGRGRQVHIGEGTTAQGLYILCRDADVTIGRDCMFSREIEVRASDVHKLYDARSNERLNAPAPVRIGDHVWVAARAFISKGACVPDGSVVGALSFVNRAFEEPGVVIAGVPARVIRRNVRWDR